MKNKIRSETIEMVRLKGVWITHDVREQVRDHIKIAVMQRFDFQILYPILNEINKEADSSAKFILLHEHLVSSLIN